MDFGDEGIDVGEVQKNKQEVIKVRLRSYKDHDFVDIRVWVDTFDPPRPTKKGVAVSPRLIPDLVRILQDAHERYEADKEGTGA